MLHARTLSNLRSHYRRIRFFYLWNSANNRDFAISFFYYFLTNRVALIKFSGLFWFFLPDLISFVCRLWNFSVLRLKLEAQITLVLYFVYNILSHIRNFAAGETFNQILQITQFSNNKSTFSPNQYWLYVV